MLLTGTKNVNTQTVLTDGLINIGNNYRRYCKRASNGLPTFVNNGNGITLNGQGIYHITGTFVASGTEAGNITVQALENDEELNGILSSQTITTPDTELRTLVVDFYVLVETACVLNCTSVVSKTISFENSGIGATFTSVVVNAEKVV